MPVLRGFTILFAAELSFLRCPYQSFNEFTLYPKQYYRISIYPPTLPCLNLADQEISGNYRRHGANPQNTEYAKYGVNGKEMTIERGLAVEHPRAKSFAYNIICIALINSIYVDQGLIHIIVLKTASSLHQGFYFRL